MAKSRSERRTPAARRSELRILDRASSHERRAPSQVAAIPPREDAAHFVSANPALGPMLPRFPTAAEPAPQPGPAPEGPADLEEVYNVEEGPVPGARPRLRHWMALAGFVALVLVPFIATTVYLYTRAADQYHSEVAFSIRSEEVEICGGGAPRCFDLDRQGHRLGYRHPVRIHPQPGDRAGDRRQARPPDDLEPRRSRLADRRPGIHPRCRSLDRGIAPPVAAHGRSRLRFQRRDHRRDGARLHRRGRQAIIRGDPRGIEQIGEPALRPVARGRGTVRPRRARRGGGPRLRDVRQELADFRRAPQYHRSHRATSRARAGS